MPLLLLVAFVAVPIIELAVIGAVSGRIGLGWTLLVLVADSVAGAVLVRHEGRRAWQAFRGALAAGRWPADEVVQGALVLVGGALLLTPGFVTDGVGLLLVLPWTRPTIARWLRRWLTPRALRGVREDGRGRGGGAVLDVEVLSVEREEAPGDPSGEP